MNLKQRINNLLAWSLIDPHTAGSETAQIIIEEMKKNPDHVAQIIYPDKRKEILQRNPEATLDDLIQE